MAVRIRMKRMGRKKRPFYRVCATDIRSARDGRVIEELGYYDPMVHDTDARAILKGERIQYWLSVGAQPSDKVAILIKKYGVGGTHVAKQQEALARIRVARKARGEVVAHTERPAPKQRKRKESPPAPAPAPTPAPAAEPAPAEQPAQG